MKILVTGGAGFIGSNFIRYLLKNYPDYKIVNLDKLTYAGNLDNLKDIEDSPNYQFFRGDICDLNLVRQVMDGCDLVVNFAAESHVDRSILGAQEFVRTNVMGTNVLLESAKNLRINLFVQVSTDEVYGSIRAGSFKEEDRLSPSSPYSASKAAADLLCRAYFVTHKIPIIITRSSNNFGPYQYPEKLIPLFITNAIDDKPVPVYGEGANIRDWLFVIDNCRAMDLLIHRGRVGEIYNIGAGNEVPNIQITELILDILGKPKSLIRFVEDRPGHDFRYSVNSTKIRKLGWVPQYSFKEALKLTVEWYKSNEWWWRKLKS
jgi:dTDP-glucose 4,6-dehydratase